MNEPAQDRHWHWKFVAWNGAANDRELKFAVSISVLGYVDEATATMAARDIVIREQYALQQVYECNTCGYQAEVTRAMNRMAKAAE